MYCGVETTNAPDSIVMWRIEAGPPSLRPARCPASRRRGQQRRERPGTSSDC
jgi:hypothetical protein